MFKGILEYSFQILFLRQDVVQWMKLTWLGIFKNIKIISIDSLATLQLQIDDFRIHALCDAQSFERSKDCSCHINMFFINWIICHSLFCIYVLHELLDVIPVISAIPRIYDLFFDRLLLFHMAHCQAAF